MKFKNVSIDPKFLSQNSNSNSNLKILKISSFDALRAASSWYVVDHHAAAAHFNIFPSDFFRVAPVAGSGIFQRGRFFGTQAIQWIARMQYKLLNANRKCPLLSGWAELVYAPAASATHYLGIILSVCKRIIRNKENGDFGNLSPISVGRKRLRCFQTLKCASSG